MAQPAKTVFISYRRKVSSYIARAIFMDLQAHGYDVFMDVESIDSGTFDTIILNQIAARAHFIVILTPGTVERCAEPGDWLRREIERAQDLGRNIVPVLVNDFSFKETKAYLTGKLEELSRYNGVTLHHDYFEEGMDRLRKRFLKKPVAVSITPTPPKERAAVQRKIVEVAQEPIPTKTQMSAERWCNSGYEKGEKGDYRGAIADYSQGITLNPQYATAYNNRGFYYYQIGEYQKAIADFKQAIKINPQFAEAYANQGVLYKHIGYSKRSIADFNQAIKIDSQNAIAYYNRGDAYDNLGEYQKAIADFNQAIKIDPQYIDAYYYRGYTYGKLLEYQKAIADFNQVIKIDPQFAEAYTNRGVSYKNLGYKEKAIADFRKVSSLNPTAETRKIAEEQLRELGEEP